MFPFVGFTVGLSDRNARCQRPLHLMGHQCACVGTAGPLPAAQAWDGRLQQRLLVNSVTEFTAGIWGLEVSAASVSHVTFTRCCHLVLLVAGQGLCQCSCAMEPCHVHKIFQGGEIISQYLCASQRWGRCRWCQRRSPVTSAGSPELTGSCSLFEAIVAELTYLY